ncbi:hypothetical protein [Demequina pelophila]|uniref:variant leucine-rich repeat-containing protein n=1 Tax=Demequina pelophila TaxID=1638984 RepID=UPI0007862665|nr:hypothetical protein [Demequina pelophila]
MSDDRLFSVSPVAAARQAADPSTSGTDLESLSRRADPRLRQVVASHAFCPPAVLARLAEDPDVRVRCAAAVHPALPAAAMRRLAANVEDVDACEALASNPSTPPTVLARLARHPGMNVRLHVARNVSADTRTLETLARDVEGLVRNRVSDILAARAPGWA